MMNSSGISEKDFDILLDQARRFCDKQERCISELKKRLLNMGCDADITAKVISTMIVQNHLNEQRFASSYARGKFRIKKWGRLKIIAALYQMRIPQELINNALDEINEDDYHHTLKDILEKKWRMTPGESNVRMKKTAMFAISKGYESSLVFDFLTSINK